MDEIKQSSKKVDAVNDKRANSKKLKDKKNKGSKFKSAESGEVLLSLPAGFKYKLPGKRQRIVIGSIVVGLNILLVIAVLLYFYNPGFQEFIYNVGRS